MCWVSECKIPDVTRGRAYAYADVDSAFNQLAADEAVDVVSPFGKVFRTVQRRVGGYSFVNDALVMQRIELRCCALCYQNVVIILAVELLVAFEQQARPLMRGAYHDQH